MLRHFRWSYISNNSDHVAYKSLSVVRIWDIDNNMQDLNSLVLVIREISF